MCYKVRTFARTMIVHNAFNCEHYILSVAFCFVLPKEIMVCYRIHILRGTGKYCVTTFTVLASSCSLAFHDYNIEIQNLLTKIQVWNVRHPLYIERDTSRTRLQSQVVNLFFLHLQSGDILRGDWVK